MEALLPWFIDFEQDIKRSKDPIKAKAFWLKLAWQVTSCHEAAEVFPDMRLCPVCMEKESEGVVTHKFFDDVFN